MGSVGKEPLAGVKLPTIKLDTTLTELYRQASPENADMRLGWISCAHSSGVDLTPDVPRNTRFLYQDQVFINTPYRELRNDNAPLKWSLAKKYLSLIPQRDAFVTGSAPVVLFNLSRSPAQVEHDRREAEATMAVLDPSQRPELVFCPGPAEIPLAEHGIDKLEYKVVPDGLPRYPLTHDADAHWLLNSKAALARSGLPTPPTAIIETEGCPPADADACCHACANAARDTARLPTIPAACTGPRGQWLAREAHRILSAVQQRPVPFVFKTQQAFGGAGTWLVTSDEQKACLLAELSCNSTPTITTNEQPTSSSSHEIDGGLLRKLLSLLAPANANLRPTTILLSDMIAHPPGSDFGLTFFVTSSGKAHFLAAAEQMLAQSSAPGKGGDGGAASAWVGSKIDYPRQGALRERFEPIMQRIAGWIAERGYVGPVGADVLETEQGELFIVDLNVRTCGSVSLPLLRGHFEGRGLGCASSFSIAVKGGRREFVEKWRAEFEEGRMLILSWYEDPDLEKGGSVADVVVGGEDEDRLQELMRRVRESTEEVTF